MFLSVNFFFKNVSVDDFVSGYKEVFDFFIRESLVEFEFFQVGVEEFLNSRNIFFFHFSESFNCQFFRNFVNLDDSGNSLFSSERGKVNVNEFFGIEGSVVISGSRKRSRNNDSSGVNSLPHVFFVDSSGDFFNENGS